MSWCCATVSTVALGENRYRELRPPRSAGVLTCVWSRSVALDAPAYRVVPDGCVDVIFSGDALLVAGPDTTHHATTMRGELVGARFLPGAGSAVLGVGMHALRDARIELAEVWPAARVRVLTERLAEAGAVHGQRILAEALTTEEPVLDPIVPGVRALAARQRPVAEIADAVGFGERQLHRRCLDAFGYGAKTLTRVLRFHRALARARDGVDLARVAHDCGYADQAHLAREVRELAGAPLSTLRAE
ncbi:MAG: helix-turn-helix domain-containing protein [Pseudonocardiaceae bacterium]|nr:helix-turn-helix domain-containing protein [Pseudonocardiaceae bacterium]